MAIEMNVVKKAAISFGQIWTLQFVKNVALYENFMFLCSSEPMPISVRRRLVRKIKRIMQLNCHKYFSFSNRIFFYLKIKHN